MSSKARSNGTLAVTRCFGSRRLKTGAAHPGRTERDTVKAKPKINKAVILEQRKRNQASYRRLVHLWKETKRMIQRGLMG